MTTVNNITEIVPNKSLRDVSDIKHAFYINLAHRQDRKRHVLEQLKKIGVEAIRFNAVKMASGAIGCTMSHLKCMEHAKRENWDHVLIVEDDITFLRPRLFINQFNTFLKTHDNWDVVLLAGSNLPPHKVVDNTCIKVAKCQTTTGYIVKNHYYDAYIKNIREGLLRLMREPDKHVLYAIDKYWFSLQDTDNWYLITPLTVVQKEGYSDIEKKQTNYYKNMTDLDKPWLERNRIRRAKVCRGQMDEVAVKPSIKLNMNI